MSLKLLGFQLKVTETYTPTGDYINSNLLGTLLYHPIKMMEETDADVIVFPEYCYNHLLDERYKKVSDEGKLVIAGTTYTDQGINCTVVFEEGKKFMLPKLFPASNEPMFRTQPRKTVFELYEDVSKYMFEIKGCHVVILTCSDYLNLGNLVCMANLDKRLVLISACHNNNTEIFKQEAVVIHNKHDLAYSFVINCISTVSSRIKGESFIYGPIQKAEQDFLRMEGKIQDYNYHSAIFNADTEPCSIYCEVLTTEEYSRYERSLRYKKNPVKLEIKPI